MSEITSTQIKMLKKLYKHDGLPIEELKKYIDIDKHDAAFNELLRFEYAKYYLETISTTEDDIVNEYRYYKTPAGKKCLRQYKDVDTKELKKILVSKWSEILVAFITAVITYFLMPCIQSLIK